MVPVDAGHPGLLLLDRSWSIIGTDEPHFHLDLPGIDLPTPGSRPATAQLRSRASLAQPWSFIGLLGGRIYAAVRTVVAQLRALEAADAHWPCWRPET